MFQILGKYCFCHYFCGLLLQLTGEELSSVARTSHNKAVRLTWAGLGIFCLDWVELGKLGLGTLGSKGMHFSGRYAFCRSFATTSALVWWAVGSKDNYYY